MLKSQKEKNSEISNEQLIVLILGGKKTWDQKCLDQKLKCKLQGMVGQKFNMMIYRLSMKSIS